MLMRSSLREVLIVSLNIIRCLMHFRLLVGRIHFSRISSTDIVYLQDAVLQNSSNIFFTE
jgi:hypothetical protein